MAEQPDDQEISDEQFSKARDWLVEKWGGDPAPECPFHKGRTTWEINTTLVLYQILQPDGTKVIPGRTVPALLVGCQVCGYIVTLGAIRIGVVEPDAPPARKTKKLAKTVPPLEGS